MAAVWPATEPPIITIFIDYNPETSKTRGTTLSQPIGIIWMPWHIGLNSLIRRAAISTDWATLSLVDSISLIKFSGTDTPATFLFMNLAIPADFKRTIPAKIGTFKCFILERKFSKIFIS